MLYWCWIIAVVLQWHYHDKCPEIRVTVLDINEEEYLHGIKDLSKLQFTSLA